MKGKQKNSKNSTNIQADVVNVNNSVALYSIEEVAKQLMNSVFGELPIKTKKQIEDNQKSYFSTLSESLVNIVKQGEDLKSIIDSPDFQYISKKALISASRSTSNELHKNLSLLITRRIEGDGQDLKKIVFNEAISTVGKLTQDQLKIISLCYLLRYTSNSGIVSIDTYKNYLELDIKPFLDFKNTHTEFQHIEYTGCGSLSIGSWDALSIQRNQYSSIFSKPIEKQKIDTLALSDELFNNIAELDKLEDKYTFKFKNKILLQDYLKDNGVTEEESNKIVAIYDEHIMSVDEIKGKISKESKVGHDLIELWEKSVLKHLSLTSVGIAIAANHFEQMTGNKVDIGIWIN